MKKLWLASKIHSGAVTVGRHVAKIRLPVGCVGVMFVFKTKKAARKYFGKDVGLIEMVAELKP